MEALLRRYWLFLLFTAVGLLFFSYHYLDDLARQHSGTMAVRFIEEMTGAYAAMVLVPLVFWAVRRFPWTGTTWPQALAVQIGSMMVYTVAHTTLMAVSRAIIFPLAGLGTYDYGTMIFRYPMEASHDAIFYAVTAVLIYLADRLERLRHAEVAAAELQTELAEAKLENLRLQLHPHFLFNTLNAISSVMYEDVRKADAMLVRLSDFLRVILNSTDVAEITLDEELQIEGMYFNIMKARLESTLQLSLRVEQGAGAAMVPSLILQPLIENAIEHGMRQTGEQLDISIEARNSNGEMHLSVTDNGAGTRTHAARSNGGGRGIANVKSRLSHLYGEHFAFQMEPSVAGGTQVTLTFPFRAAL